MLEKNSFIQIEKHISQISGESNEDDEIDEDKFSDRKDLVRIDHCYHRFHLLCLHRYWFMPRASEVDEFGDTIHHTVPD